MLFARCTFQLRPLVSQLNCKELCSVAVILLFTSSDIIVKTAVSVLIENGFALFSRFQGTYFKQSLKTTLRLNAKNWVSLTRLFCVQLGILAATEEKRD